MICPLPSHHSLPSLFAAGPVGGDRIQHRRPAKAPCPFRAMALARHRHDERVVRGAAVGCFAVAPLSHSHEANVQRRLHEIDRRG